MNYRHAFHAGNFADCMKHALLVWLLRALAAKEKPFRVLDTHAGIGSYDLSPPPRPSGPANGGAASAGCWISTPGRWPTMSRWSAPPGPRRAIPAPRP